MKRLLLMALALLGLLLVCCLWVMFPRQLHGAELDEFLTRRPQNSPPGVQSVDLPARSSLAVSNLPALGTRETPDNKHLRQLIGEQDKTFLTTCRDFEGEYRVLQPQIRAGAIFTSDSYISGVRDLQRALGSYAEILLAREQQDQALEVAIDSLLLARQFKVSGQHYGFYCRYNLQERALDTLEYVLARCNWSEKQLQTMASTLEQSVIPDDLARRCLEEDIFLRSKEMAQAGESARQIRLYQNQAMGYWIQLKDGKLLPLPVEKTGLAELYDQFLVDANDISLKGLPETQRSVLCLKARQGLDHLLVCLKIYRSQHGRWPAALAELPSYKALDGFDPALVQWRVGPQQRLDLSFQSRAADRAYNSISKWPGLWKREGDTLKLSQ